MNKALSNLLIIVAATLITACRQSEPRPVAAIPVADQARLQEPFHFARSMEIKPGLTIDVLSWGRGASSGGAFLILLSDSTHLKYTTTTGDLDGELVDAWNMDMDADGNPEVFIQAKGEGEGSYLTMYIYELAPSGSAQRLRFPDLTENTRKSYRGMDSISIKDGKLRRSFPLFKEDDNTAAPTGGKKLIEYDLRNNNFTVKEIVDELSK